MLFVANSGASNLILRPAATTTLPKFEDRVLRACLANHILEIQKLESLRVCYWLRRNYILPIFINDHEQLNEWQDVPLGSSSKELWLLLREDKRALSIKIRAKSLNCANAISNAIQKTSVIDVRKTATTKVMSYFGTESQPFAPIIKNGIWST